MKWIVKFAFLFLAFSAQAEVKSVTVGGEYGESKNKTTQKESTSLSTFFTVGLNNNWSVEARNITQQTNKTSAADYGAPLSWQEVGATKTFDVWGVKVYGKELVGMHETTAKRYAYHAEEVGMTGGIFSTPFEYSLAYRWVDSFKDSAETSMKNEQTRLTFSYNIDKNNSVRVRFIEQRGATPLSGVNLGYSYRF